MLWFFISPMASSHKLGLPHLWNRSGHVCFLDRLPVSMQPLSRQRFNSTPETTWTAFQAVLPGRHGRWVKLPIPSYSHLTGGTIQHQLWLRVPFGCQGFDMCCDPLPCELGLVAFSWGVSVCCRNLLLSVSFLPWIAFWKIHGQMNVHNIHNIHNSCAVKTGVGSWDIACACRKNTWYIIILS